MSDSSFPKKGDDDFLTREEIAFIQRLLSRPEAIPQAFWSMAIQKIALDGLPIPQSQVQGLSQLKANHSTVVTSPSSETTTSTSYVDLATVGPTISGLADGSYLIFTSGWIFVSGGGAVAMINPFVNGVQSLDQGAAFTGEATPGATVMNVTTAELRNNNNNTIQAKYRVNQAATGTFNYRNLVALKIGN